MVIASELSKKALSDTSRYDPLEVAHASLDDTTAELFKCAEMHADNKWFAHSDEFCVAIFFTEGDPLIKNLRRQKFAAFPYLPDPRPQQAVFLFRKSTQTVKRLWCLPNAATMAIVSETQVVAKQWQTTKQWSDAFFNKQFFELIRKQNKIKLGDRHWYMQMMKEKIRSELDSSEFLKLFGDEIEGSLPDPFDFSKISVQEVID